MTQDTESTSHMSICGASRSFFWLRNVQIHSRLEFDIIGLPYLFQHPEASKNYESISYSTLMEYQLRLVACVELEIAEKLLDMLSLVFDGWTSNNTNIFGKHIIRKILKFNFFQYTRSIQTLQFVKLKK